MEYFDLLPEEITIDILSRLPVESVLECKLVCTTWRDLVRGSTFSKMHFHHLSHPCTADSCKLGFIALTFEKNHNFQYFETKHNFQYFEYDENHESIERIRRLNFENRVISFLGSYNGLICLTIPDRTGRYLADEIYICNPITREYIMLPQIKRAREMDDKAMGFGYVSSTNEYKVVRTMLEKKAEFIQVYVYTLGSGNGWRNIGNFNFGSTEYWGEAIFASGVLYWLDYELKTIVPFYLAEEKFCEHLSLPFPPDYVSDDWYKLGVLDGCLSFDINKNVNGGKCWDVRLLKKKDDDHGMKEGEGHQSLGWSEVFRVHGNELFAITKSYGVLNFKGKHVNIHHLETSTSKTIVEFEEFFGGIYPHKNTFVSLKELGEKYTKMME